MVLYIYSLTGSPDITLLNVAWGYKDIPDPGGCADMTGEAISQDAPGDGNVEWHQGLGGPMCPQGDCVTALEEPAVSSVVMSLAIEDDGQIHSTL